jgi:uncharacterized protein (DUF1800 family)
MRRAAGPAALVALLLLGGVGGPAAAPAADDDAATIHHVLSRLTFGARPGDLERVRATGLARWLERQLEPASIDDRAVDAALADLPTLRMSTAELQREYARPDRATRERMASGELTRRELLERFPPERRPGRITAEQQAARMLRAVASERQVLEVMVDVWLNHFNVFAGKGEVRWALPAWEREVIRPHALGRFGDLLRASARHPAMLVYLDNWLSARPDLTIPAGPQRGRKAGLNENYARELLELHTLGVDGGYTERDVTEVARAFTGWTLDRGRAAFVFRPFMHDTGPKVVLDHRIPAGGGASDGERVLELLLAHPATARHVAARLVRRFVADDPPPALVERVAATFVHTDGDIRAVLRTLAAAPEFLSPAVRGAKVRKPLEFVAGAARSLGAGVDARGAHELARASREIGEGLYEAQPPTGWPDRAEAWVSAGATLARMNFALALAAGRLPGVRVDPRALAGDADRARPGPALDRLLAALLPGGVTAERRRVLATEAGETDLETLTALVLGSPEFQRR